MLWRGGAFCISGVDEILNSVYSLVRSIDRESVC
jgi:hypothetical protein